MDTKTFWDDYASPKSKNIIISGAIALYILAALQIIGYIILDNLGKALGIDASALLVGVIAEAIVTAAFGVAVQILKSRIAITIPTVLYVIDWFYRLFTPGSSNGLIRTALVSVLILAAIELYKFHKMRKDYSEDWNGNALPWERRPENQTSFDNSYYKESNAPTADSYGEVKSYAEVNSYSGNTTTSAPAPSAPKPDYTAPMTAEPESNNNSWEMDEIKFDR